MTLSGSTRSSMTSCAETRKEKNSKNTVGTQSHTHCCAGSAVPKLYVGGGGKNIYIERGSTVMPFIAFITVVY